ncbi:MAG: hypothetical protein WA175_05455 [Candidatus Acidiferrales bacterium]
MRTRGWPADQLDGGGAALSLAKTPAGWIQGGNEREFFNKSFAVGSFWEANCEGGVISDRRIAQGTSSVSFAYDNANRRTSLTLPNGVVMSYSYDNASQLSAINYQLGSNSLGNLTYSYDLAGRRTSLGRSYASTGLPQPVSLTAYDAANELTEWGAATPVYDANGNTLSDGTNSYAWNGRNQLASMNMGAASFQYDPLDRRVAKTAVVRQNSKRVRKWDHARL